ncbi:LacI family DNA-binding transcriptional regulator [Clostridium sp. YIM B02505]|uniref:LacI family DNA-binding transcriptional regulator n=1 Tax=Clostridium yunnanense TaxID=2800325 RepID=A0ABS1EQT8_9CLOT|nr:LacI family DNA-binding transcriptional regulator [Clostridium yunnanense]MBK1811749.1 LacI family DNA-binding transcriptional regulator [Clostridium yunnanense]
MRGKITIRDVAEYAGVSVATVSNVINNISKASEETKARVLKAIEEIGYQPDYTARTLAKGRSNLIGIMLPITEKGDEPGILLRNNPFFSELVSGIEYVARKNGYDILMSGIETDQKIKKWINRRSLDGLILLGIHPKSFYDEMKNNKLPIVLVDSYDKHPKAFHRIMVDDEGGGYMATKHLLDLGHRNIVFATGNVHNSGVNLKRFEGYKRALSEAGIEFREELVIEDHVTSNGGYEIGKKIMDMGKKVTAVFAVADILAFGIIKAFTINKKRVPEDYSIIGFDDIKSCEYVTPGLTTIKQDIFKKGMAAAKALIDDIESGMLCDDCIIHSTELIIRESTKKIK